MGYVRIFGRDFSILYFFLYLKSINLLLFSVQMIVKQFPLALLEYDETKNILFFRVKQDQEVDVDQIKEMLSYTEEFIGQKKHCCVVDFGGNLTSTTEARKIYADSGYLESYRIADAFIVRSLGVRIVANFFINVTKPKVKTKLFVSDKEAVAWLESVMIKESV